MTWCLVLLPDNVILYKDGQRQSIVPTETDVYSITAVSEDDSTVVKLSHRTLVNMRAADYNSMCWCVSPGLWKISSYLYILAGNIVRTMSRGVSRMVTYSSSAVTVCQKHCN